MKIRCGGILELLSHLSYKYEFYLNKIKIMSYHYNKSSVWKIF